MKNSAPLKAIVAIVVACYPFAIFYAIKNGCGSVAIAILLGAIILGFFLNRQKILLCAGLFVLIASAISQKAEFVKLYPVVMNFTVMAIFSFSLMRKPFVQIIGERMRGTLPPKGIEYARKATIAWSLFMLFLTLVSLATVFMSDACWAVFNGLLSYVLIALMFLVEYLVRRKALQDVY